MSGLNKKIAARTRSRENSPPNPIGQLSKSFAKSVKPEENVYERNFWIYERSERKRSSQGFYERFLGNFLTLARKILRAKSKKVNLDRVLRS